MDSTPDTQTELRQRLQELCQQASEISSDVSALTRELHSPKLELLGIVPAMRGFCEELANHQKVTIDFQHSAVPSGCRLMFLCACSACCRKRCATR